MNFNKNKYMISYFIEKILGYKTYTNRQKIDALLELDANQYCNLGSDSTKTDRNEAKKQSRAIYRAIKQLDNRVGDRLLFFMDK